MLKIYSTKTKQMYDTEKEATAAEAKFNEKFIQLHCDAFKDIKKQYIKDLTALQDQYAQRKASVISALKYYQAPPEIINSVVNETL